MNADLTRQLHEDIESAEIDDEFKVLLKFVRKVTAGAYRINESDYDRLYAEGWDDESILDAINVTCLFNFMNRLVSSLVLKLTKRI